MKSDKIYCKLGIFLLNSLYKISLENYYTKFIEIPKIPQIYYRISYTKNQDFANLMKIIIKYDIPALKPTFCHEVFIKSPWVFSYAPGISFSLGKHPQRNGKRTLASTGQIFLKKSTSVWFIAWRPHMKSDPSRCHRDKIFQWFQLCSLNLEPGRGRFE